VLLAVEPRFRKSGIGSALLKWLKSSCVTAGIQDIRLEVRAANSLAQRFYRNRGFAVVGRIPGYYDRREAAVVMEHKLAL
jgi:ribosomal-protein-alanine N-acetyltransferase